MLCEEKKSTNSVVVISQKEIELRKKQYEYYRDLLLTFPTINVDEKK
jgi:type I restriction enzyme S subunit